MNPSLESQKQYSVGSSKDKISELSSSLSVKEAMRGSPKKGRFPSEVEIIGYNSIEEESKESSNQNIDGFQSNNEEELAA